MSFSRIHPAILLLADGTLFEGASFGFVGTVMGEVVFNTGMTGYQEVLTDPSYAGQLVTFTYPEIGNTGVNKYDQESFAPHVKGIVIRQLSPCTSSWRAEEGLNVWLQKHKVVGISGVDTRALVRHLREGGSMNGVISSDGSSSIELFRKLKKMPSMQGLNLVDKVTTNKNYQWNTMTNVLFDQRRNIEMPESRYKVVAIDFGIKRSILERLSAYGCDVKVVPASTDMSKVISYSPEGVFLSNGPGDPSAVTGGIELVRDLIDKADLPIFGICLGHQILGLAVGAKTFKLPYGHRGLNHPCGISDRVEITSQNHGFAIDPASLPKDKVQVSAWNLNDQTVSGITFKEKPIFGVQYHPEASPGPHDSDHHFEKFVSLMAERR